MRAEDDPLVGIWVLDEGYQITELLFRPDRRYQLDLTSTNPDLPYASTDRGRYQLSGQTLGLLPYDYFGTPQAKQYELQLSGTALTLTSADTGLAQTYQLKADSRADVLARQNVPATLIGTWTRTIASAGTAIYTFRPGNYYVLENRPADSQFPSEFIRGRYQQDGQRLSVRPYSGTEAQYELDFFGSVLTLITSEESRGESAAFEQVAGSEADVRARAAEADAFLSRDTWQVGVWEIREAFQMVDLTMRPDGHYIAREDAESLRGIVRGRYVLDGRRIQLLPFVGQGLYAHSSGDFGLVERAYALDYFDAELQLINLEAISQSVTIARKQPDSEAVVLEKARHAQAERGRDQWYVGIWQADDPLGWMEFTFRPDGRYIGKAGDQGVPSQVERGRYVVAGDKATLAPYPGLGPSRGFEIDLYDGDLFLIGDLARLVIARNLPDSEADVVDKARNPVSMHGERGTILGRWTANMPGASVELVFRPDGEFRESRCEGEVLAHDYGLWRVDMDRRTVVYDSRFVEVQSLGLDFYGSTLTLFGGLGPPRTFTVKLGVVDQAIAASLAADAAEAQVDAQWLGRVPVGPRDPSAVQVPTADIPSDPAPEHVFEAPTVLTGFALYRRLLPGFVYFNEWGTIKTVPVVNSREWYLFPTGRALIRFRNHHAGPNYPTTTVDISDSWAAYRVEPRSDQRDILHRYADNRVFIASDVGEQAELTLEDGRRTLFWGKDSQILSEWASEQRPEPCQVSQPGDASLINTGLTLTTSISPDSIPD